MPNEIESVAHLDQVLFYFKNESAPDAFTLRDATQGIFITGAVGSGKSTGSGEFIARSFLRKKFGGVVFTGKIGEREEWERYAKEEGRQADMIYFAEGDVHRFNPLLYEMSRTDQGGRRTETMTSLFVSLAKMGSRIRGGSKGGSDDPFWDMALERMIKAALDVLKLSKEDVTVQNMAKLLSSAPAGIGQAAMFETYVLERALVREVYEKKKQEGHTNLNESDIYEELQREINFQPIHSEWSNNFLVQSLIKIENTFLSEEDKDVFQVAKQYFLTDLPTMADKTRASILEMFYAFGNPFRAGLLHTYCSQSLTEAVMPEHTFEGKIIVLDFPIHRYGHIGLFVQCLYKKTWQEAVQRRRVTASTIPVFLWADECQFFLSEEDMLFLTTARSSKACSVFITQNISNLHAMIGGKDRVNSILGNLVTKIFHSNNDYVTNEWASRTIAKTKKTKSRGNLDGPGMVEVSEAMEDQVSPQEIILLKNGGALNDYVVEGIVTSASRHFSSGTNYLKVRFKQSFAPKKPEK